jgi:uncharacterized protein YukE
MTTATQPSPPRYDFDAARRLGAALSAARRDLAAFHASRQRLHDRLLDSWSGRRQRDFEREFALLQKRLAHLLTLLDDVRTRLGATDRQARYDIDHDRRERARLAAQVRG